MESKKYHISLRIVHWLMAFVIISLIVVGWYMTELPREDSLRSQLYSLHKSFGATILFLIFIRLAIRIKTNIPELPATISQNVQKLAHSVHHILYLLMLAVPLSGVMMSNMYGYGVNWFGIALPKIFSKNKELASIMNDVHAIIAYSLLVVIILHVAGVVKHKFFENPENDILKRMV